MNKTVAAPLQEKKNNDKQHHILKWQQQQHQLETRIHGIEDNFSFT